MTPQTMTLDECRDELARLDGWTKEPDWQRRPQVFWSWWKMSTPPPPHAQSREWRSHPHPATLDGAAAALPNDWVVRQVIRNNPVGWACSAARVSEFVGTGQWTDRWSVARNEITARYRLALACRLAEVKP